MSIFDHYEKKANLHWALKSKPRVFSYFQLYFTFLAAASEPAHCRKSNPVTPAFPFSSRKYLTFVEPYKNKIHCHSEPKVAKLDLRIDTSDEVESDFPWPSSSWEPFMNIYQTELGYTSHFISVATFFLVFLASPLPSNAILEVRGGQINLLSMIDNCFQTMPYLSGFVACGVKSSCADFVAQFKSKDEQTSLNFQRNIAYILYGGLYLGCALRFIYDNIFPQLFGTGTELSVVASKVLFDNFFLSPLVTFPLAYQAKSLIYGDTISHGIKRYVNDVKDKGLLLKAWALWIPVQCLTFSVIPEHLQIVFIAAVSFFWLILLSSVESAEDGDFEDDVCATRDGITCDFNVEK